MQRKKLMFACLCLCAVSMMIFYGVKTKNAEASAQKLEWHRYDEALKLAKKSQKYVLVDFMAVWCGYCKLMQDTTYKDPKILELLKKKFVLARVDIEGEYAVKFKGETVTEADLSMYYEVTGTPTTWFFDSRGNAITPLPGYVAPDKFHGILKYIAGGYYKKMKFSEFIKKKL